MYIYGWWFGTFLLVHILGISSSQLTFIFFRGVGQPPTRYIYIYITFKWVKSGLPSGNLLQFVNFQPWHMEIVELAITLW